MKTRQFNLIQRRTTPCRRKLKSTLLVASSISLLASLPATSAAGLHISELPASEGRQASPTLALEPTPEALGFQLFPGSTLLGNPEQDRPLGGFNELLPFILASPDQEDAGSCLYMAITGIAEWWSARLHPQVSRAPDGPLDLSERYIMNFAGIEENETGLPNWRTDSIYLFNRNQNQSVRNTAYRYTKDWYVGETYGDHLTPATGTTPGAEYGTSFNWIDQRPAQPQGVVRLPELEREVIFADPQANQWNVGVAPATIVEQVKETLRTRKAPILVIYNQNSYWHAVFIVGFNDEMDNGNCAYTERFRSVIVERAEELAAKAAATQDPVAKKAYEIRAQRAREAKVKIEAAYAKNGGCSSSKGVFYIRDSIYPDENGPLYHYNLAKPDDKAPYSKKVVFKEYDWLRYFSNHISVVFPKPQKQQD